MTAWRWMGWFSLVLAIAGVGDWLLAWTPLRLGNPEWEFGTVVASFSGLPLVSLGFAGLRGSALARGVRWQIVTLGWVILLFAVAIAAALVLFILDIPIAVRVPPGPARLGIAKAIAKALGLGLLFGVAYFVAAIGALRAGYRRPR
jgi:hypothetical protein